MTNSTRGGEKVSESQKPFSAKAVANVDLKGLAEKARKEAEGAAGGAGDLGEKLKGLFGK